MTPRLLAADRDAPPPDAPVDDDLVRDLELGALLTAMAGDDERGRRVALAVLLDPLRSADAVRRRQAALEDCRAHPEAVAALDGIAREALAPDRGDPLWMLTLHPRPDQQVARAARRLERLLPRLDDLRAWTDEHGPALRSAAFAELVARIRERLDDDGTALLRRARQELSLPDGVVAEAGLDGVGETLPRRLRRARPEHRHLFGGAPLARPNAVWRLPERDQAGAEALAELADRALEQLAAVATDGVDRIERFFALLHDELGFLAGGVRLRAALEGLGVPLVEPVAAADDAALDLDARDLVDPCLALVSGAVPVGNDVRVEAGRLLVITGANHGGKSTLLRAIGLARLMLQAGLPVAARSCAAVPVGRIRTHWPRAEDEGLEHGKLDDELARMHDLVAAAAPGDLLLSNESFASTNEREGAAIALEVVTGLSACGVRVALVTHLVDLADALAADPAVAADFLRAPRDVDGSRPFRLEPGPPLPTAYGADLFDRVFGTRLADRAARS